MPIFTPEILAMAEVIKNSGAVWGVDDEDRAYAEFEGVRATAPIEPKFNEWWPLALRRANEQAHATLEAKLGRRIEYYRLDKSHPNYG